MNMMWFREDLRTDDNTALFHAAKNTNQGVVGVYILDRTGWLNHHVAASRIDFILRGLHELRHDLNKLNIPLVVIEVTAPSEVPIELAKLVKQLQAHAVFFNRQYEVNERKRDQVVQDILQKQDVACYSYDDQVIFSPGTVCNQQGEFYKVFTAYKRAWYRLFLEKKALRLLPCPALQPVLNMTLSAIPTAMSGVKSTVEPTLWSAGEREANRRLRHFIKNALSQYDQQRDFPALSGTSQLSPYLAAGMISPRRCFMAALLANNNELETGNKGAITWMVELIWRDFYKHILLAVPRVSMNKAYNIATEKIHWKFNKEQFLAWQQGQTGYPLIDAAMRQLNLTGWMHNRLRMIVAMFFTKNLFFDWRLGEQYFMSQLIDGDLAANNGGWQWCASTGTDSAPYFRVFNPLSQSKRFDPEGDFIRQYCPELADFDSHSIHDPHGRNSLLAAACGYPQPTVDLKRSRQHAIEAFRSL
jgi:deoxyribodipyrimidine photo-lyase